VFLLPSLALGVLLAYVLGGRPSRLLDVPFRLTWTVFVALVAQLLLFLNLGIDYTEPVLDAVHVGSYALLVAFALANLRLVALVPAFAGMALNAIAIAANGGVMPVAPRAADAAGIAGELVTRHNVSSDTHRLWFLGDVFALPPSVPLTNVFSIGDVLIAIGMIGFVVYVSMEDARRSFSARRLLRPLATKPYRRLVAGRLVSQAGDWLTVSALIGWIYQTTHSVGAAAAVLLCRLAPPIVGGSVAAVVVDRLPKQRLLVAVELGRAVAVTIALAGLLSDQLPLVLFALALSGALATLGNAVSSSLVPALLPENQLASANAGLGIARDGAMALGAGLGGLAVAITGPGWALLADVGTFFASAALFAAMGVSAGLARSRRQPREPSGLRYILAHRSLLLLALCFAAATIATGLTNATLPAFMDADLGLGPGGYGFGIAALALGLAFGQAAIGFTEAGPAAGRWIAAALVLMAGLLAILAVGHDAPTALLLLGAIGFVDGTTDVLFETAVQRDADPRYYGAVFGFTSSLMMTTMMIAVALAPLAHGLVAARVVLLGATAFLLAAGVLAFVRTLGPRRALLPAAGGVLEPDPRTP
jgi:MFS family permease